MLEKNNKISVLTKMIGIGDEKTPQLIVPQNSLTNLHARMGLSEKSVNTAAGGAQAPTISCPHCQNMAKNFLYLESLIRANGSPKNRCSLCSSTLRYVEYVNKSILDVFAKNASIIEAAQKYNAAKPRFRMPKLMSRVSRLTAGGRKSGGAATTSTATDSNNHTSPTSITSGNKRQSPKRKSKANDSTLDARATLTKNISKASKTKSNEQLKKAGKSKTRSSGSKLDSKMSIKGGKAATTAKVTAATAGRSSKTHGLENDSKSKTKSKTPKKKSSSTAVTAATKKESFKAKRKATATTALSTTSTGTEREAFAA